MLVTHTLKRSAGIGGGVSNDALDEKVGDLADALVVVIAATGFLEVREFPYDCVAKILMGEIV